MDEKSIILLVVIPSFTFLIISIGITYLVYVFFKAKQKFLVEKTEAQLAFISELNKTKQEIQDQTLTYIGRELHDNIGQLLTISKIHSNALIKNDASNKKLGALDEMLDKAIIEIKQLSKSLDSSRIAYFGFHKELQLEVARINNTKVARINLQIEGTENIENEKAIVLYRILQEFISNSMKYSQCDTINISLFYTSDCAQVYVKDNGIGFAMESVQKGSGLNNIRNRITVLSATDILFTSDKTNGTALNFKIPSNSTR